jgi:hypothetical protein
MAAALYSMVCHIRTLHSAYNYIILLIVFIICNIYTRKYTRKKSGLKKISWDILGQSPANKEGGRELAKLGHAIHLLSPRTVKPYVLNNKTDAADARAICDSIRTRFAKKNLDSNGRVYT